MSGDQWPPQRSLSKKFNCTVNYTNGKIALQIGISRKKFCMHLSQNAWPPVAVKTKIVAPYFALWIVSIFLQGHHNFYSESVIKNQTKLLDQSITIMRYARLPVRHGLPNQIVVCLSYNFSHWSRPHVGLAFHAIMRGWVNCTQFQQNSLISGHVSTDIFRY